MENLKKLNIVIMGATTIFRWVDSHLSVPLFDHHNFIHLYYWNLETLFGFNLIDGSLGDFVSQHSSEYIL